MIYIYTKHIDHFENQALIIQQVRDLLEFDVKNVLYYPEGKLEIDVNNELTPQEQIDLDNLVNNFVESDPELKKPVIYDYVKPSLKGKHHHDIDYVKELTVKLIPKRTIVKGEVQQVDWYASLDAELNPINKVLTVEIVYQRDEYGFATSRTVTRTWINRDNSNNLDTKVTTKYYFVNHCDMIDEGLRRRKLLVNNLQLPTLTFIQEVLIPQGKSSGECLLLGREFMDRYDDEFNKFIDNSSTVTDTQSPDFGKKNVVVKLEDTATDGFNQGHNVWLDGTPASLGGTLTIRQYLISEFSI
jgi:hypothetical protein